jgi:hypothetical protein
MSLKKFLWLFIRLLPVTVVLTVLFQPLLKTAVTRVNQPIYSSKAVIRVERLTFNRAIVDNPRRSSGVKYETTKMILAKLRQLIINKPEVIEAIATDLGMEGNARSQQLEVIKGLHFDLTENQNLIHLVYESYSAEDAYRKAKSISHHFVTQPMEYSELTVSIVKQASYPKNPSKQGQVGYDIPINGMVTTCSIALAIGCSLILLVVINKNSRMKRGE